MMSVKAVSYSRSGVAESPSVALNAPRTTAEEAGNVIQPGLADVYGRREGMRAGLADVLHVDVMPVLLGTGTRLFDDPGLEGLQLEKVGVDDLGPRTSLRFRVLK